MGLAILSTAVQGLIKKRANGIVASSYITLRTQVRMIISRLTLQFIKKIRFSLIFYKMGKC